MAMLLEDRRAFYSGANFFQGGSCEVVSLYITGFTIRNFQKITCLTFKFNIYILMRRISKEED